MSGAIQTEKNACPVVLDKVTTLAVESRMKKMQETEYANVLWHQVCAFVGARSR